MLLECSNDACLKNELCVNKLGYIGIKGDMLPSGVLGEMEEEFFRMLYRNHQDSDNCIGRKLNQ